MFEKENVWRINDLQPRERAVSVRSKATLLPMMLRCACASISPGIDWIKRAAQSSNVLNYNWRDSILARHCAGPCGSGDLRPVSTADRAGPKVDR